MKILTLTLTVFLSLSAQAHYVFQPGEKPLSQDVFDPKNKNSTYSISKTFSLTATHGDMTNRGLAPAPTEKTVQVRCPQDTDLLISGGCKTSGLQLKSSYPNLKDQSWNCTISPQKTGPSQITVTAICQNPDNL